jgi:hypothetical protein
MNYLTVADVIYQLRGELARAAWQGEGKDPRLVVGNIELELSVVFEDGASGDPQMRVIIGADSGSNAPHRIKLSLAPLDISGRPSRISGPAEHDEL